MICLSQGGLRSLSASSWLYNTYKQDQSTLTNHRNFKATVTVIWKIFACTIVLPVLFPNGITNCDHYFGKIIGLGKKRACLYACCKLWITFKFDKVMYQFWVIKTIMTLYLGEGDSHSHPTKIQLAKSFDRSLHVLHCIFCQWQSNIHLYVWEHRVTNCKFSEGGTIWVRLIINPYQ